MSVRSLALKAVKSASVVTDPLSGGRRKGPRILIYHQVGAGSGLEMNTDTKSFRYQVEWMLEHGRVLSLDDALAPENIDSDDVYVLTFDDGHISLSDNAFPIMVDLDVPFVLYISTAPLEGSGLLHDDPLMPLLSWARIREMHSSGLMTVGSHTHEHMDLRRHPAEAIDRDIATCDEIIEEMTGVTPVHFTYPWGRWSPEADTVVRSRYRTATVGGGPGVTHRTDLLRLPRVPIMASDSGFLFERKMWGGFRLETSLRRLRDRLNAPSGVG